MGGVRRYFTAGGEPIGLGPEGIPAGHEPTPISVRELIDQVPRKRTPPPFDPTGAPRMDVELSGGAEPEGSE